MLMADGLDLCHRLPLLWQRVEAGQVRVYCARLVARRTRDLSPEQAAYVDSRVAEYADGRLTWTRFERLVDGAVAAADAEAAAQREHRAAEHQFARPTRAEEGDGAIRGFYIRAPFGTVAVLDATLDRIARILARLGDNDSADQRRVKALLILCRPDVAAGLYQMVATGSTEATTHPPAEAASPVDWSALLPTVVVYLHCYRGPHADRDDTPARRGGRPGRGCRTTHADLGP
jgi:hypothetical protein